MFAFKKTAVAGLVVVLVAGSVALIGQMKHSQVTARAEIRNASGQKVGDATLTETAHGVLIAASFTNLPAGTHAFHVHDTGKCEPPFTTAGAHFNPTGAQHGIQNPKGMHSGDIPNLHVGEGGVTVEVLAPDLTIAAGRNSVLDADGSALVVHDRADDYTSDPAGNAGDRIACGVITK